jgi:hypothetical protein
LQAHKLLVKKEQKDRNQENRARKILQMVQEEDQAQRS